MIRPLIPRAGSALRAATIQSRRPLLRQTAAAARTYSIQAKAASATKQQPLDASKLAVEKTHHQKALKKPEELVFGRNFTGTYQPPSFSNRNQANI